MTYQGFSISLQHPLPLCAQLLLHHNFPRLQRFALPTPYGTSPCAHRSNDNTMVCLIIRLQHGKALRACTMDRRNIATSVVGYRDKKPSSSQTCSIKPMISIFSEASQNSNCISLPQLIIYLHVYAPFQYSTDDPMLICYKRQIIHISYTYHTLLNLPTYNLLFSNVSSKH